MRFIGTVVATAALAYGLGLFLPWYSIAIAAFIFGILLHPKGSFFAGFLAIGLLWFVNAWLVTNAGATSFSRQVAEIFFIKSELILMIISALLGALVGGFASLTGAILGRRRKNKYY